MTWRVGPGRARAVTGPGRRQPGWAGRAGWTDTQPGVVTLAGRTGPRRRTVEIAGVGSSRARLKLCGFAARPGCLTSAASLVVGATTATATEWSRLWSRLRSRLWSRLQSRLQSQFKLRSRLRPRLRSRLRCGRRGSGRARAPRASLRSSRPAGPSHRASESGWAASRRALREFATRPARTARLIQPARCAAHRRTRTNVEGEWAGCGEGLGREGREGEGHVRWAM
jgi:hypothetical protein